MVGEVVDGYVVVGPLVRVTVLVLVLVLVDAGGTTVVVTIVSVTVVVGVVDEVVVALAAAITPQANRLPESLAAPLLR
ncbi:hypothetical protein A5791_07970 [Mycobacterium sp. 852002-51163_SCH5372311]|nr:hypothetical protein [Mycobacterium sp. 852002-51163_SCH5372311]OBF80518.1 hypothetical protein A5791_07970 [Mycobacterium sp. 852002-51163_SCH5372311]